MKVSYETMKQTIKEAFLNAGLNEEQAELCATTHTDTSRDGVYSHGLNRVPSFIQYVKKSWVKPESTIELVHARGAVENYDGHEGIGIINAFYAADRAVELAKEHGMACVTLKNTSHWMRGGTYTRHIAAKGYIGMAWINTESVMPAWGAKSPSVGNCPFCLAIPRAKGMIALDMAMSQYAFGKLGVYELAGKNLPFPGGYDKDGSLTCNPGEIIESKRLLPVGYWKGSGMSLALDMAAAAMANGLTGADQDKEGKMNCSSCCQIFIAVDPYLFASEEEIQAKWDERIDAFHQADPVDENTNIFYPGERTELTRAKSLIDGIEVDESIWAEVQLLAKK